MIPDELPNQKGKKSTENLAEKSSFSNLTIINENFSYLNFYNNYFRRVTKENSSDMPDILQFIRATS